ncbi:MAG: hypothetical protein ISR51_00805 [Rhodospirillales bacterium]|nr:hypothetical protein [Rhodospirillales bacterium]
MQQRISRIVSVVALTVVWGLSAAALGDSHVFDPFVPPADGKGSIYGKVTARPHKDYIKKATKKKPGMVYQEGAESYGASADGKVAYNDTMVNYDFVAVYAILLDPAWKPGKVHEVEATADEELQPRSIAVAKGDVIHIENATSKPLTFFLADINSDAIQELPVLASGDNADMVVELTGDLELAAEEDDRLIAAVLSRKNLRSQRVRSGSSYAFRNINPGDYEVMFWFWRLGHLIENVTVVADEHSQVNGVLSVDTVVH